MKIESRFRGLDASASLQLSRFGRELGVARVRLGDVNGPRGGIDTRCRQGGPSLRRAS